MNNLNAVPNWCKALKISIKRLYNLDAAIEYNTIFGYVVSIFNNSNEILSFTSEASFSHEALTDFMA